jgi:hypothetical protein
MADNCPLERNSLDSLRPFERTLDGHSKWKERQAARQLAPVAHPQRSLTIVRITAKFAGCQRLWSHRRLAASVNGSGITRGRRNRISLKHPRTKTNGSLPFAERIRRHAAVEAISGQLDGRSCHRRCRRFYDERARISPTSAHRVALPLRRRNFSASQQKSQRVHRSGTAGLPTQNDLFS